MKLKCLEYGRTHMPQPGFLCKKKKTGVKQQRDGIVSLPSVCFVIFVFVTQYFLSFLFQSNYLRDTRENLPGSKSKLKFRVE